MPTNLTGSNISATYDQLLHLDDGPAATEKVVYGGTGVATALKVGTQSVSVDNIQFNGNTISSTDTNGDIELTPNGTGVVTTDNLSFDGNTIATTDANGNLILAPNGTGSVNVSNINVTGGSISGVAFSGTLTGITSITSTSFFTDTLDAGLTLAGQALTADGTDTDIDINLVPKGAGEVNIANVDISSVGTARGYGIFYDLGDQTFSVDTPTVVQFDTTGIADGVSVVSGSRVTFTTAGTYEVTSQLQFQNTHSADHVADIWFRLNGADIPYSASEIGVPKAADGGKMSHSITGILNVTAGQYVEVVVAVDNAAVSLHHHAPFATPGDAYNRPDVPSAFVVLRRVI